MTTQTVIDNGTDFTITRTFEAPTPTVWDVWTQGEHFEQWFHAVPGSVELQVRPDGPWSAVLQTPYGDLVMSGVYREVVQHRKLVWTLDAPEGEIVMTANFIDHGPQTEVVYAQNVVAPYTCEQAIEGGTGILDSFEQYLGQVA
jgi:uncharacterized protein YndB with AHSA1/START domain